jgi:hypothetical protein
VIPTEVVEYLAAATAAGIVGNTSYAAVTRLAAWVRRRGDDELTEGDAAELAELFQAARTEWTPAASATATQSIAVGRDMNAPAINRADARP